MRTVLYGKKAANLYTQAFVQNTQARALYQESEDTYYRANDAASYDDWRRARHQWDYFYNRCLPPSPALPFHFSDSSHIKNQHHSSTQVPALFAFCCTTLHDATHLKMMTSSQTATNTGYDLACSQCKDVLRCLS